MRSRIQLGYDARERQRKLIRSCLVGTVSLMQDKVNARSRKLVGDYMEHEN